MKPLVHFLFLLLIVSLSDSHISAQVILPDIGSEIYSYSQITDRPVRNLNELDFYSMDFHCMSRRTVRKSELPRTDFELVDQQEFTEVYALRDNQLILKGFRIADPYIKNTYKFIQLISGIPMINLDKIQACDHSGEQNIYLEYNVADLPDQVSLWAEVNGYSKLRLKVNIQFESSYGGSIPLEFADYSNYYKVNTSYAFEVVQVQMKKEDWQDIELAALPAREEYLQLDKVAFSSYYNGHKQFPYLRLYEHPNLKVEFHFDEMVKDLPICSPEATQVYVYPNPTLGDVNIRMLDLDPDSYIFALYNIVGIKVWETTLRYGEQDFFQLRLPHLEKGVYLYSIKNKKGRYIQSRRLTVLEH